MAENDAVVRRLGAVEREVADPERGSARVRVALAVTHDFVRFAVAALLAGSEVVELVGQTGDAVGTLALLGVEDVDVLVLDRRLPDGSSPDSIRTMRDASPATSIVVVAMSVDGGFASEAIGAGAAGYVLKDAADTELVEAVLAAAHGDCYVSPRVSAQLYGQPRADPRALGESQTAVLRLIALGHGETAIGRELGLSGSEVEACRAQIFRRLGIASRAELARYAVRHGLLVDA